ncbi:MAG: LysM peptidoglycan-binding domain-containing protein [Cellvibrionaceae bacterium]|nr:LysM peptidoglycan-binding domain-containing protein [Cellvibrionaceae bacterium]
MGAQQAIDRFDKAVLNAREPATVYVVQAGDTLSDIIIAHYGIRWDDPQYKVAEAYAVTYNSTISHPDHIRAGDTIRLMPLPKPQAVDYSPEPQHLVDSGGYCPRQEPMQHRLEPLRSHDSALIRDVMPIDAEGQEMFTTLSLLQHHYDWAALPVGALSTFEHLTGPGNVALVKEVGSVYEAFKRGELTRGQYDYRRAKLLKQLSSNLGSLEEKILFGKPSREAIRIVNNRHLRSMGIPATANVSDYAVHLSELSRVARHGGVLLTAFGAAVACENIGDAETQKEKNEVFVEYAAGATIGTLGSIALGAVMFTTPVGWGVALVLGAATAFAGWSAGKKAKAVYSSDFQEYDLVSDLAIDKICK